MTSTEALAVAAERDFVAAWWLIAEAGRHERHADERMRWFQANAPDAYLNMVLETRLTAGEVQPALDEMLGRFSRHGHPFTWWVMPGTSPAELGPLLVKRGLEPAESWPAMAVAVDEIVEPRPVGGLVIERVADAASFGTYVEIYAPVLSSSQAFTETFADAARRIGFAEDAPEVHWIARLNGEPVATVSLVTAGGAAGIYNVATVPSVRGRGIGAVMTAAAARAGGERGLALATLQASTMGRPVYERLGFRFVCDFTPYRSPPTN